MLTHLPDHFSSQLHFKLKKIPSSVTDRSSLVFTLTGLLCGLLLLFLGIFELFSFIRAEKTSGQSLLTVEIFSCLIILAALGLIFGAAFSIIRYKKFFFNGKEFHITYRPAVGIKHQLTEPLENYIGVRLRVLFTQSGLFNKNRYIIDLFHQDKSKIVPLYISTRNKDIRKIWEGYAKAFKLPALTIGDRGLVQREYTDLDKSVKELAAANKLPFIAKGKLPAPASLFIKELPHATLVEPRGIYWDVFGSLFLFISIAAILLLTVGGVYLTIIGSTLPLKYWLLAGALLITLLYFSTKLFTTHSLKIEPQRISVQELLFNSVVKESNIDTKYIENVELSYNPTIDRYSLTIISDDKLINFGSRLSVDDLLWLKDFVLRKLIGN